MGSTAPHAYYVDQGTGVYAGRGPYAAKILPPWTRGSPSLYESTWRPGTEDTGKGVRLKDPVGTIMIKGQRGQGFLDAGLRRGFTSMRLLDTVGGGAAKISEALSSFPTGLEGFAGNTPADGAFVAQLQEWREWRDAAWNNGDLLGNKGGRRRPEKDARRNNKRAARSAQNAAIMAAIEAKAAERAAAKAARERAANIAKFKAATAAAEARKKRAKADAKARKERAEAAAKRKEERAQEARAADRLARGNRSMRREATEFYKKIREAYPNATFRETTLADGTVLYRVSYSAGGETVRQDFAYGYDT